jgi:hypothetical protein
MARYRCLAPIYTPGGAYVEIAQVVADDGTGDYPIPSNFIPPPCLEPLDASAIAKLRATGTNGDGSIFYPSPSSGWCGLWGPRTQFSALPLPAPSAVWSNLVHP